MNSDYKNLTEAYEDNTKTFKEPFESWNYFGGTKNRTLDAISGTLVNCAASYYGYYGGSVANNIKKCQNATNAVCKYESTCGVYPIFKEKLKYYNYNFANKSNEEIFATKRLTVKVGDSVNISPFDIDTNRSQKYVKGYKGNLRFSLLISENSGYETFNTSNILPPGLTLISSEGIIQGTIKQPTKKLSPLSDGTQGWYYSCTILMIFKDNNGVEIFQRFPILFEIRQ